MTAEPFPQPSHPGEPPVTMMVEDDEVAELIEIQEPNMSPVWPIWPFRWRGQR